MERELLEFHERVRAGFLALAAAEPGRWLVLDALEPIEKIQGEVRRRVEAVLNTKHGFYQEETHETYHGYRQQR
jgi:dTMP kinase